MAIFISYASENQQKAESIYNTLLSCEIPCWIASENLRNLGGEEYQIEIAQQIKKCEALVIVYSQFAIASNWVNGEITLAFNNQKPIITFFVENIDFAEKHEVMLPQYQVIKMVGENWDAAINCLRKSLLNILAKTTEINDIPSKKYKEIANIQSPKSGLLISILRKFLNF